MIGGMAGRRGGGWGGSAADLVVAEVGAAVAADSADLAVVEAVAAARVAAGSYKFSCETQVWRWM